MFHQHTEMRPAQRNSQQVVAEEVRHLVRIHRMQGRFHSNNQVFTFIVPIPMIVIQLGQRLGTVTRVIHYTNHLEAHEVLRTASIVPASRHKLQQGSGTPEAFLPEAALTPTRWRHTEACRTASVPSGK